MAFIPGVELSRRFYAEAVRPLMPDVPHTAALIGPGSDVLGFDTERSTDHGWGPRLLLLLDPADLRGHGAAIDARLRTELPVSFAGYPTNFGRSSSSGSSVMIAVDGPPIEHRVVIADPPGWFVRQLGFDPGYGVGTLDWLGTPTQRLAEVVGGAVFHDDLGLAAIRERLRWYPDDVWRYVLAGQWRRIAEEEAFVGRCTEVGDDLGARLVTARLTRDLARLQLLMHRRYPPYSKWLGSAARGLVTDEDLGSAYGRAAATHNGLGLTDPVDPTLRPYYDRPFRVLGAGRFADALRATITDPVIAALPPIGAVDQFVDASYLEVDAYRAIAAAALGLDPH